MALLLLLSMAAGMLPVTALAEPTAMPAETEVATSENAAPATPETVASTATPAPMANNTLTADSAPMMLMNEPAPRVEETPEKGDTITIDGIEYEVDRVAVADRNGALTLTNGAAASGALVLADGIEYAGGLYDITALEDDAFKGNNALTSIDMSASNATSIGDDCFNGCTMLTTVDLSGDKFKTVRKNAFKGCTALTWVDLSGETSKSMGEACFSGCSSLKEIVFPQVSYTNFTNKNVFFGCTSLTELYIPTPNIGGSAGKNPFNGCNLKSLIVDTLHGEISSGLFSSVQDGFTLTVTNERYSSDIIDANAFGSEKTVTLYLPTAEDVEKYTAVFADKENVTVKLYGGEEEALATVIDPNGVRTPCATLMDAIAAVNAAETEGTYTIQTRSTGATTIEWTGDVAPNKATVIDFAGASVDLPDTLTLQAPLTIENITNINPDEDTLTILIAGGYAFAMVDGGSFGFAEIRGSDLTFAGTLPGGQFGGGQDSRPVQLTGTGDGATVTFVDVGRSDYYYVLPNMAGFAELVLDGAYLEADAPDAYANQLAGTKAVTLNGGGLTVNKSAEIETLSGNGELRVAEGAVLTVTGSASGSFRLPDFTGTELAGSGLSLPLGSDVTLTNANGETVTLPEPVVQVEGLGQYATMAEAFAAIESGEADSYTITLLDDVELEATGTSGAYGVAELPAKALIIQGSGHTLSAGDSKTRNYVYAAADLTLVNVELNMPKTYLRITGEGATVTVESTVTGALEKIDASVSTGCTVLVKATVGDDVIDGIAGTSKNKMTVILQGYGSLEAPAAKTAFPTISNSSGTLVLENSWLVADNAANWGGIEVRQGGGLSLTGSMPNASVKGWQVGEGVTADLTVKNGKLTVNGAVSGKTQIHLSGSQMAAEGKVLVKAANGGLDSFVLAQPLDGLTLLPDADGNYTLMPLTVAAPVVTLSDGSFGSGIQFASWQDAAAVLEKAAGSEETYTVTLNADLTLPADTTLPDTMLVFDGGGHTLTMADGDTLQVQNSLTLQNVKLDMDGAALQYIRAANGEKTITFAATASGSIGNIEDISQSRWLDIVFLSDSVTFDKVTGTTSTIGTQLTDLILTGFGSKDAPIDLTGRVENIAALELNGSWVKVEGDATSLGTIRTDYSDTDDETRTSGLVLTGDATVAKLSVTTNDAFEVWIPSDATLTVLERYSHSKQQVPVYADGPLTDGHALIKAPSNSNRNMTDYLLANAPEGVDLYWDANAKTYQVNCPPVVAMSDDAVQYGDAYTKVLFTLSDAQGVASVAVNGAPDAAYAAGTALYAPDTSLLIQGSNTVTVTDATGKSTAFAFRYDAPADYSKVEQALAQVPADLSGYTAESVQALQQAVDGVEYGYGRTGQAQVDAMAQAILDAVAALKPAETGMPDTKPNQPQQPADEHPEIADAIANGTWGQPKPTPAPTAAAGQQAAAAVPQTADAAAPVLWMVLAVLSLGGAGALLVLRRRRDR